MPKSCWGTVSIWGGRINLGQVQGWKGLGSKPWWWNGIYGESEGSPFQIKLLTHAMREEDHWRSRTFRALQGTWQSHSPGSLSWWLLIGAIYEWFQSYITSQRVFRRLKEWLLKITKELKLRPSVDVLLVVSYDKPHTCNFMLKYAVAWVALFSVSLPLDPFQKMLKSSSTLWFINCQNSLNCMHLYVLMEGNLWWPKANFLWHYLCFHQRRKARTY